MKRLLVLFMLLLLFCSLAAAIEYGDQWTFEPYIALISNVVLRPEADVLSSYFPEVPRDFRFQDDRFVVIRLRSGRQFTGVFYEWISLNKPNMESTGPFDHFAFQFIDDDRSSVSYHFVWNGQEFLLMVTNDVGGVFGYRQVTLFLRPNFGETSLEDLRAAPYVPPPPAVK